MLENETEDITVHPVRAAYNGNNTQKYHCVGVSIQQSLSKNIKGKSYLKQIIFLMKLHKCMLLQSEGNLHTLVQSSTDAWTRFCQAIG